MSFRHFGEILRHRASEQSEALAYTFLADGETESDQLSYAQLDRKARIVGAHLQALGAKGERVILLFPPDSTSPPPSSAASTPAPSPCPLTCRVPGARPQLGEDHSPNGLRPSSATPSRVWS